MKLIHSFSYAFRGIIALIRSERNMKLHLIALIAVCIAGWYFRIQSHEWVLLLIVSSVVLVCEGINTAIEKLCDALHPEQHPTIGIVKDIAAGSVLIAAIIACFCGGIIFYPYIF